MKVFKFNPETGKRGAQIDNVALITFTDQGVDFQVNNGIIQPISYNLPIVRGQNWTAHVDAGTMKESYLRDEWVCFCMGSCVVGYDEEIWEWKVLPPKSAIKPIGVAA